MSIRFSFAIFASVALVSWGCSRSPQSTEETAAASSVMDEAFSKIQPSAESSAEALVDAGGYREPRDVIAEGRFTVDVMQVVAPPQVSELGQRLQLAAQANPEWWVEHVSKAKPGEPLEYDARMGLSEREYSDFLALSKKMTTQKASEATLTITKKGEGVYVLDGGEALADLTGFEIDLENDWVRAPFGDLTQPSPINAGEESAMGSWTGSQWKLDTLDPTALTGVIAKLAVGKLKQSGRCVIYYDAREITEAGQTRITHILNFDRPAVK